MSYVYLLLSSDNATYIGATVDLDRRLRQHNKEIKGGAHATGAKVAKGETWIRAALTGKQRFNSSGVGSKLVANCPLKCARF